MRSGDRIAAAERVRDKKRGLRLLYFTGARRRSLFYRRRHGYLWFRGRSKPAECRRKSWIAGVRCGGQHYSPWALSAPPLIAVFVVAPTISLPSSYTSTPDSSLPRHVSRSTLPCLRTRCLCSQPRVSFFITVACAPISSPIFFRTNVLSYG